MRYLLFLAALAISVRADDFERIKPIVDKHYAELDQLYTTLHANPELSTQEKQTAARLAAQLKAAGYDVTENVGGHGVVAVMKNGPGKTLLIRTDLDALPVKEETGAPYASTITTTDPAGKTVPVMHACGHDVHVTCMVGVARTLSALKDKWSGTLVLIGQPAEETVQGARAMLKDGLYTRFPKPDACLALHVDGDLRAGKVGYVSGFAMANVDTLDVVIRGVGGHGSAPHTTKDPIVIAAQTIVNLQTIASREVKATEAVVVTVGSIHGGTKHNIIPNEVTLQLTIRTYKDNVREQVLKSIERIVNGTATTAGVPSDRMPTITARDESVPACYNDPKLVEQVVGTFKKTFGDANVIEKEPTMGAEDFGLLGRQDPPIPCFMFRLGSVEEGKYNAAKAAKTPLPSLHSSIYLPHKEPTIRTGVQAMSAAALDFLKK